MKRPWVLRGLALGLSALGLSLSAGACAENESSIFIHSALVPDGTCAVTFAPGSTQIGSGVLDAAYSKEYRAWVLMGNQMVARGSPNQLRTETSRVQITGFDVFVDRPDGSNVAAYYVPAVGFIDPASGSSPGYGGAVATLIDSATSATLGQAAAGGTIQDVTVTLQGYGKTLGGLEVTTGLWSFPISVCYGCLCRVPAGDTCTNFDEDPEPACTVGQDFTFDCRLIEANCL